MDTAKNLLNAADLKAVWRDGQCNHAGAHMGLYGLCATLSCHDCGTTMSFLLKFGRPKTFEVTMNDHTVRPVGQASPKAAAQFLHGAATNIMIPDGPDPESISPERDAATLTMLSEELIGDSQPKRPPKADFVGPWRDIGCSHKSVSCQLYGNRMLLECTDCATEMTFTHTGRDMFHVAMARLPLPAEDYGWHQTDSVLGIIREFAHTLEIPNVMADRMSHDPDRDARQIAALVSLLERHGLLRRTESVMEPNFRAMAQCLSAMSNTRREFVSSTKSFVAELDLHFSEDGRRIGIREGLEALWLTWPCGFEGEGLDVEVYDPIGGHQYCVRCGFSTLDDRMENDHWRRGCPECGYPGYLLDMDGGPKGARAHV